MRDLDLPRIGGLPVVRLHAPVRDPAGPAITGADIAPGRGMLLLQVRAHLPGRGELELLAAPPLAEAARRLDGGIDDFAGNQSFAFGGAVLVPYANRICGRPLAASREIATDVLGQTVRLPRNWGGRAAGARQFAMHGLILDRPADAFDVEANADRVQGVLHAGDFAGRWLSATDLRVEYALSAGALELTVEATNVGADVLPIGIGWHPYFALPGGDRRCARLHVPARARALVDNYDDVLPTGKLAPVAGTSHDLAAPGGRPLAELYLDDCFVDLDVRGGRVAAELVDPLARLGVRVSAAAPPVQAFQIYAPLDRPYVAIEPQYNLADPFGSQWRDIDTGMVMLRPGESTRYAARVELFSS